MQVVIAVTAARHDALKAAGKDVPQSIIATLLLDTGAEISCIDKDIVQKLELQPTGSANVNTPSTGSQSHQCFCYDVDIVVPVPTSSALKHIPAVPVIEADFSIQGHQGLIGRDILKEFRFTYSGPDDAVWISF